MCDLLGPAREGDLCADINRENRAYAIQNLNVVGYCYRLDLRSLNVNPVEPSMSMGLIEEELGYRNSGDKRGTEYSSAPIDEMNDVGDDFTVSLRGTCRGRK